MGVVRASDDEAVVAVVARGEGGDGVKEVIGGCSSSLGMGEDVTVSAQSGYESVVAGDDAESKVVVVAVDGA